MSKWLSTELFIMNDLKIKYSFSIVVELTSLWLTGDKTLRVRLSDPILKSFYKVSSTNC